VSNFVEKYTNDLCKILEAQFPDLNIPEIYNDDIKPLLNSRFQDQEVIFANGYNKTEVDLNLSALLNSLIINKPILTGYGVTFKNHKRTVNLPGAMLKFLLDQRKTVKRQMLSVINTDKEKFANLDREQKIDKLLSNAYYGAAGERNSIFFNIDVGSSITYTGVQIITTAILAFESFLGSNFYFSDVNDALFYITQVLEKNRSEYIYEIDKEITADSVIDIYLPLIHNYNERNIEILRTHLNNLNQEDINFLYFKNNLYQFLNDFNDIYLQDITSEINNVKFLNAENPPEEIIENLNNLWDILDDCVADYIIPFKGNRLEKIIAMERNAVLLVDTDSCFLNLDPFIKYCLTKFEIEETAESILYLANIMIYLLNKFIQKIFDELTERMNLSDPNYKKLINMKNEFLNKRVMLTNNKKQYASNILMQEGKLLDKPKFDIKGLSIKKVSVNKTTRDIFSKILENDILSKKIKVEKIIKEFVNFESTIRESLTNGELSYAIPANLNEIASYKFPYRQQQVRGAVIWNALFPDNVINPPDKVSILKLKVNSLEVLKPIFDTQEYFTIKKTIFDNEELSKYGFGVLAVPKTIKIVPEWITEFIDLDVMISDNIRNGLILLESLGVKILKLPSGEYYSNIINF